MSATCLGLEVDPELQKLLKITRKFGINPKTYSDGYTPKSAINMCDCLREIISVHCPVANVAVLWEYIDEFGPGGDSETIAIIKHPGTGELLYVPITNFLCCGSEEDWKTHYPGILEDVVKINNMLKTPNFIPEHYGVKSLVNTEHVPKFEDPYNLTLIPWRASDLVLA